MAQLPDGNGPGFESLFERVKTALQLGVESPSVEFKAGSSWNTLKTAIIKTVLAMSNLRGGGLVIVGRPESSSAPEGINTADLATFDPDVMRDQFDEYASPRAVVSIARVNVASYNYVAVEVEEFEKDIVICKKNQNPERQLTQGTVYIRPFTGRPKSVPVGNAEEMQSVIELAIDKGISLFEDRARRRGYERTPSDAAAYGAELADLDDA
jgi:hypothetical protein